MLSKTLIERARAILPGCRTLTEAEVELGGGMCNADDQQRDWYATCRVWGLHDGFQDRPAIWNDGIDGKRATYRAAYHEAYAASQRLAREERKPCPTPAA